jgi:hypothetical protein
MPTLKDKIEKILIDCDRVHLPGGRWFDAPEATKRIIDEIDKEQMILRPALRWFAGEMEEDLRKNEFKGGWLDGELDYYREKALKHLMTLENIDSIKFKTIISKKHAIDQCIKSANYMMMIAHNLIEELRKGELDENIKD